MIIPNPSEIVLDELEYVSTQFLPHEMRLLDVFDSGIVSMIKNELTKRIDDHEDRAKTDMWSMS